MWTALHGNILSFVAVIRCELPSRPHHGKLATAWHRNFYAFGNRLGSVLIPVLDPVSQPGLNSSWARHLLSAAGRPTDGTGDKPKSAVSKTQAGAPHGPCLANIHLIRLRLPLWHEAPLAIWLFNLLGRTLERVKEQLFLPFFLLRSQAQRERRSGDGAARRKRVLGGLLPFVWRETWRWHVLGFERRRRAAAGEQHRLRHAEQLRVPPCSTVRRPQCHLYVFPSQIPTRRDTSHLAAIFLWVLLLTFRNPSCARVVDPVETTEALVHLQICLELSW